MEFHIDEQLIKKQIEQSKYCYEDRDCTVIPTVCPFGCCHAVNKQETNNIYQSWNRHRGRCTYSCPPCGKAICVKSKPGAEGRCSVMGWKHMKSDADNETFKVIYIGLPGTSFTYKINRDNMIVSDINFESSSLQSLLNEIDYTANQNAIQRIHLKIHGNNEKWPIYYGYRYINQEKSRLQNIYDFLYMKFIN